MRNEVVGITIKSNGNDWNCAEICIIEVYSNNMGFHGESVERISTQLVAIELNVVELQILGSSEFVQRLDAKFVCQVN